MPRPDDPEPRRCNHECKDQHHDDVEGRRYVPSHPADPRQRVGNAHRTPTPYVDLQTHPNLTGTYFESGGRYRLFINHVGGHLECLLTLVSNQRIYTEDARHGRPATTRDARLPDQWGPLQGDRARPPIAFRFSGEAYGSQFMLEVPPWMIRCAGKNPDDGALSIAVGLLEPLPGGDAINVSFDEAFVAAWPEHRDAIVAMAIRSNHAPVLLDRYLDQPWISFGIRTALWFPRTPLQQGALVSHADAVHTKTIRVNQFYQRVGSGGRALTIQQLVEEGRGLAQGTISHNERLILKNVVGSIDALVGILFGDPVNMPTTAGGVSIDDLPSLTPMVMSRLNAVGLDGATLLTALVRLIDDAIAQPHDTPKLIEYLGIGNRGWGSHQYRVRATAFKITDFADKTTKKSAETTKKAFEAMLKHTTNATLARIQRLKKFLPLTYFYGDLIVEYTGVSEWDLDRPTLFQETPWRGNFTIALVGLQASRGGGDATTLRWDALGWSRAGRPLSVEEVEGTATLLGGTLIAGMGGKAVSGNTAATLSLHGAGNRGGINVEFTGTLDEDKRAVMAQMEAMTGWVSLNAGANSQILPPEGDHTVTKNFDDYWVNTLGTLSVHFPTNGARLPVPTEQERNEMDRNGSLDIREALAVFAACELPLIMDPNARIDISGHADRPDADDRNTELSRARADSVLHHLHGLLGDRLTWGRPYRDLEPYRIKVVGKGEADAAHDQSNDSKADPRFRRVDVTIFVPDPRAPAPETTPTDGHLTVVKLRGRDDPARGSG